MSQTGSPRQNSRRYLTLSEVRKMLDASRFSSHPERNYCLIFLAFVHGLRASELCSLKLSDMDLTAQTLCIRRLKSGFSTVHPFAQREKTVIRRWLDVRRRLPGAGGEWLFPSERGPHHLTRQMFHYITERLGVAAGLPLRAHPHMLRHGCGYALADRGIDTRLIQDYLGHRNIQHTVLYTASNPARFAGVWGVNPRRKNGLHFGLKCRQNFT